MFTSITTNLVTRQKPPSISCNKGYVVYLSTRLARGGARLVFRALLPAYGLFLVINRYHKVS